MPSAGKFLFNALTVSFAGVLIFVLPSLFSGCSSALRSAAPAPTVVVPATPVNPPTAESTACADGNLWHADGRMLCLFATPRATRVGNILTVRVVESATAKNSATTKTGRNSEISAGIDQLFTLEKYVTPYTQASGSIDSQFEGNGSTDRSGKLMASITVRVVEVLPDGNMRIAGSRDVAVNNERQFITLTGLVRPEDVDYTNTILSTYISDAKIVYSGSGIVDDRQRPGWLMRTLDVIWPF